MNINRFSRILVSLLGVLAICFSTLLPVEAKFTDATIRNDTDQTIGVLLRWTAARGMAEAVCTLKPGQQTTINFRSMYKGADVLVHTPDNKHSKKSGKYYKSKCVVSNKTATYYLSDILNGRSIAR